MAFMHSFVCILKVCQTLQTNNVRFFAFFLVSSFFFLVFFTLAPWYSGYYYYIVSNPASGFSAMFVMVQTSKSL